VLRAWLGRLLRAVRVFCDARRRAILLTVGASKPADEPSKCCGLKRRLWIVLLILGAILAVWLDHAHPFPTQVMRNGHRTAIAIYAIL
jgi:hypothetical protein